MLGSARWASWESYNAAVEPKHVTQAVFDGTRDHPPLSIQIAVAYEWGTVMGMLTTARIAIEVWAKEEKSWFSQRANLQRTRKALQHHVRLTCERAEGLLVVAGDATRLRRLLQAIRELHFVLEQECPHYATKMMPAILVLATECSHDLVDSHTAAVRGLHRDLSLPRMPKSVRPYFEQARDLLLLRHDEMGAFAACRGLERGCKTVAAKHSIAVIAGGGIPRPLADGDLNDVMEALSRCQWSDGSPVIDKAGRALLHFVRQMRNAAGHGAPSSFEEWRETAVLAAGATCRLLERSDDPNETITPTVVTKNW